MLIKLLLSPQTGHLRYQMIANLMIYIMESLK